ncbi:UNVERIFIED_CONTAM: DnaJ subfamily C GRV2, partial [Sesamum indicum]
NFLKFVEEQRASLSHHGSYDLKDSHSFVYEALSKELYIANVYLRVYNDQPDFEITKPEDFCLALVDFISHLVHNAPAASMDTHVNSDVTTDGSAGAASDDSSASLDGKSLEREDLELVKNLQYGLLSLHGRSLVVFRSDTFLVTLDTFFSVISALVDKESEFSFSGLHKGEAIPLFECFSLPVSSSRQHSSAMSTCFVMVDYICTLSFACSALASTPELAWAAAKHGGLVFILEVLLPIQEEIPLQQRAAAASLLGKLVGQTMHGPRVAISLARFLPDFLVSVIRDGPGEAVVIALEQTTKLLN